MTNWLLRFLLHLKPYLALASAGADLCVIEEAFTDIAISLGYGLDPGVAPTGRAGFTESATRHRQAETPRTRGAGPRLLPRLAEYPGRWHLGPTFTRSALMRADADLITAWLLLDLKTDSKLSLGVTVMFQVVGYPLPDFDDSYRLTELGIFSARDAHLAIWNLGELLDELAGHSVSLADTRQEFLSMLWRY